MVEIITGGPKGTNKYSDTVISGVAPDSAEPVKAPVPKKASTKKGRKK